MKIPITNFLSIVGLHLQSFNFLFLKFLKLIPFAAFSIFFAGLFSCKDLKEERSGPTLVTTWDTTVTFFNFILPGDSLILIHSLASATEKNKGDSREKGHCFRTIDYKNSQCFAAFIL
jgi:hypothetical protein